MDSVVGHPQPQAVDSEGLNVSNQSLAVVKTEENVAMESFQNDVTISRDHVDISVNEVDSDEDEYSNEVIFGSDEMNEEVNDQTYNKRDEDFVFKFLQNRGLEAISSIVKTLSSLRNAHKMNVEEQDRKSNEHTMLLSVMSNKMEYVMSMQARHGNMLRELEESVSGVVSAVANHTKSFSYLAKRREEEMVRVVSMEKKLEDLGISMEQAHRHETVIPANEEGHHDEVVIPDEPSKVTFRRRSKNTISSGASHSPITDRDTVSVGGEVQDHINESFNTVNKNIDNLNVAVGTIMSKLTEQDTKRNGRRVSIAKDTDPSDSSSSSSESDSSEGDGRRSRKKKDDSSSSDDSSDSSSGSNGSDITHGIAALGRDRRSSIFKDLEDDEDSDGDFLKTRRRGTTRGSDVLTLKNLPTMKDLYLDSLTVPNLLMFSQKYQQLQQNYHEPLKIANYFKTSVLNRIENTARRGKFKERLRRKGILCNGRQRLSNSQIWGVIKEIIAPTNPQEMKDVLRVSVFDVEKFNQFKSETYVRENFPEYVNELVNYDKQFLAMLDLVTGTKEAQALLPQQVQGGTGREGAKDKGLVQYYMQGQPNKELAWRMYTSSTSEKTRAKVKTFDDFRALYFKGLEKTEKMLRMARMVNSSIVKTEDDAGAKPPRDIRKKSRFRRRSGFHPSTNALAEMSEDVDDPEEGDESSGERSEDEEPTQTEQDGEESPEPVNNVGGDMDSDGRNEDNWLHGVSMDPDKKRPGVCFKFAKTGACEYGTKCSYSHNAEDVKRYKAAKLLGPGMVNVTRGPDVRIDTPGFIKNTHGARKAYNGPTRILGRSQDARNHN